MSPIRSGSSMSFGRIRQFTLTVKRRSRSPMPTPAKSLASFSFSMISALADRASSMVGTAMDLRCASHRNDVQRGHQPRQMIGIAQPAAVVGTRIAAEYQTDGSHLLVEHQ